MIVALARMLLPDPLRRLAYAGRRPVVLGRRIDASAQAVCDLVQQVRDPDAPPALDQSRAQIDAMSARFDRPCPARVKRQDITLPGATGPLPARLYLPQDLAPEGAPTLLYLHGGGWVQGSIASHDGLCAALADEGGLRVISLAYRLAPEHRFPAACDDVLACWRALVSGGTDLAIDPARIAVGGDSAGANLAAALLHDLRASGGDLPRAQLLIYPVVDGRLNSASMQALADQPLLPRQRLTWYLDQYLPAGHDRHDPRVAPLFSPFLSGQPQALIVVAGHDPLWDDGQAYAKALTEAGVTVRVDAWPGQVHAFASLTRVIPEGRAALSRAARWLKEALQ